MEENVDEPTKNGSAVGAQEDDVFLSNGATHKSVEADVTNDKNDVSKTEGTLVRVFKRRWIMVFLFAGFSASNAYQWIHLNIIFNVIHRYYNESLPGDTYQQELSIHWLSMVYMLVYIPFIFPATWLLDRKGLRVIAIVATTLNALGATTKCFAVDPSRFGLLMTGQTISALAQTCILGIPARLAAVWFGIDEVSTATAIGVFGNQVGTIIGLFT